MRKPRHTRFGSLSPVVPTDRVSEALLASVGVEGQTSPACRVGETNFRGWTRPSGHCSAGAAGDVLRASAKGRSKGGGVAQVGAHLPSAAAPARPGQRSPACPTIRVAAGDCGVRAAAWGAAESELQPGLSPLSEGRQRAACERQWPRGPAPRGRQARPAGVCVRNRTVSLVRLSGAASCHWTGHLSVSLGRCSGPRGHTGGCPLAEREAGCSLALKSNLALSFCLRERGAFSQARCPGSGGEEGGRAGSLLAEASPSRGSQEGGALGWPPRSPTACSLAVTPQPCREFGEPRPWDR